MAQHGRAVQHLSEVLTSLNETSLGQLVHDHKNGHLEKKIGGAEK